MFRLLRAVLCAAAMVGVARAKGPALARDVGKWALQMAPGTLGADARLLSECVSCKSVKWTEDGLELSDVTVRAAEGSEPALRVGRLAVSLSLERRGLSGGLSGWLRGPRVVVQRLEARDISVKFVAYDALGRDSNWSRLRARGFPPSFASLSSSSSSSYWSASKPVDDATPSSSEYLGVRSLVFRGAVSVVATPCELLGGESLTTKVWLNWEKELEPFTRRVDETVLASGGPLSPEALYALIVEEFWRKIAHILLKAAAKHQASSSNASPPKNNLGFSVGGGLVDSLQRVGDIVLASAGGKARDWAKKSFPGLDDQALSVAQTELATLLERLATPPHSDPPRSDPPSQADTLPPQVP